MKSIIKVVNYIELKVHFETRALSVVSTSYDTTWGIKIRKTHLKARDNYPPGGNP